MIYHVTDITRWEDALKDGYYLSPTFGEEGFIHASYAEQLSGVMERYYKDKKNLILLKIDESKISSPVKYELSPSINEVFPHIYGKLNTDAVIEATPIKS